LGGGDKNLFQVTPDIHFTILYTITLFNLVVPKWKELISSYPWHPLHYSLHDRPF